MKKLLCRILGHKYVLEPTRIIHKGKQFVMLKCTRCGHYLGDWIDVI